MKIQTDMMSAIGEIVGRATGITAGGLSIGRIYLWNDEEDKMIDDVCIEWDSKSCEFFLVDAKKPQFNLHPNVVGVR